MNKSRLIGALCASVFGFITMSSHATVVANYTGVINNCGSFCNNFGVFDGDTITGQITLGIGSPQSGYAYNPLTDSFFFDIAGIFGVDPSQLVVAGFVDTDASGNFVSGNLVGEFIYPGTDLDQLGGGVGVIGLATGTFAIHYGPWGSGGLLADSSGTFTPAVVPIPAAVWLFGSGLLGLIGVARKKAA